MYIHGSFISQRGDTVTVHIVTRNDRADEVEVGAEGSGVFFTDDPAEISSEVNDTFDHLLRQSATIRLLCAEYMADFFCPSCRDAVVNIYKNDRCVFAGFIEPQTYSQPYNEVYDEVELNCVDALSALQYSKYRNVGSLGVLYSTVKNEATQRTFKDIMTEIMDGVTEGIDIVGGRVVRYLYDGSRAVSENAEGDIFAGLAISELLFLGDEEDDVWRQDEVLEEIMRYLNLHIAQDGLTFYVFAWESVRGRGPITWRGIADGGESVMQRGTVDITTGITVDCDTQISIGEVYNQLLLTCDIESVENVVESPLDEDLLSSPYSGKQKYCTEYSADGEGETAYKAFYAMTHGQTTTYGGGSITDWYLQVMRNSQWRFPMRGSIDTDLIEYFCKDGTNQQALPNWLALSPSAAILSLGSVKTNTSNNDNSPVSKVQMGNYLVVSVNGNKEDSEDRAYPSEEDIKKGIPCAIYEGNAAGGSFSPSDEETTNYIVVSGKVVLNPVMDMTDNYKILHDTPTWVQLPPGLVKPTEEKNSWWHKTVPSRNNGDGRYYTRQYWKVEKPKDDATWDEGTANGFVPFTGEGPEQYKFKYSYVGDGTDKVSKVAVLACMLVIGDKCVAEKTPDDDKGTGVPYTDDPELAYTNFVWKPYKTLEQCKDEDEYYQQSFTIGFDPKIGDKLIGVEYDMQNTFSYKLGIDAEGIAIPIRKGDKVNGKVKFMILGPVNTKWNDITRRHPTFFRHTKWYSNDVPLLAHVSSIMVKQFEVKVYSDSGMFDNGDTDNDVVYMSDTKETFTNRKDDLEFKISSALTSAECQKLGVKNTVKLSTPIVTATGEGARDIYDNIRGQQAKPEQFYVDSYYDEYHAPRVIMEQNLADIDGMISLFNHYRHPAINKTFYVQGIGRNLIEGSAHMTIKEIWQ